MFQDSFKGYRDLDDIKKKVEDVRNSNDLTRLGRNNNAWGIIMADMIDDNAQTLKYFFGEPRVKLFVERLKDTEPDTLKNYFILRE